MILVVSNKFVFAIAEYVTDFLLHALRYLTITHKRNDNRRIIFRWDEKLTEAKRIDDSIMFSRVFGEIAH